MISIFLRGNDVFHYFRFSQDSGKVFYAFNPLGQKANPAFGSHLQKHRKHPQQFERIGFEIVFEDETWFVAAAESIRYIDKRFG